MMNIRRIMKMHHLFWGAAGLVIVASTAGHAAPKTSQAPLEQQRTWQVQNPLFEELLDKSQPARSYNGALIWGHAVFSSAAARLRQIARRFGIRYSLTEMHTQASEYKMRVFAFPEWFQKPEDLTPAQSAAWDQHPVEIAYLLRAASDPWVLDPDSIAKSLAKLDKDLTEHPDMIWGVAAGDEADHKARTDGANFMEHPEKYPRIAEVDAEVKATFGGGKWGVPIGVKDTNPYRWIAFNKWINVKLHERAQAIRAVMDKHKKGMPLVSFDPVSSAFGNDYSGIAGDYDIFTQQSYPQIGRPRDGFFTKVLSDLTGKNVWLCVHLENYAYATTPREAREMLSEVFRNGGDGYHFYLPDVQGSRAIQGDTGFTSIGSPRRYDTILKTLQLTEHMPPLKFPKSHTAILYNDDMLQSAYMTQLSGGAGSSTEASYMLLGQSAGTWFQFIDDSKVLSSPALNTKYRVIYVPSAQYQRPEIVAKLRQFVENGGTLISGDATAFSTDTLGNDTSAQRKAIFGVTVGDEFQPKVLSTKIEDRKFALNVLNPAVHLTALAGTDVIGTFENGSPAITSHKLGKGRAILFSTNPFHFDLTSDADWRMFFVALQQSLGEPVHQDIWQFQFPDSVLGNDLPTPDGINLTNNHVVWREEKPIVERNVDLHSAYQFSLAPDAMPDAADGWISFASGHLTDRQISMLDEKVKAGNAAFKNPDSRWMVSWKSTSAVDLTYDFQKPVKAGTVQFWFDHVMPTFTVQGSNDQQHWTDIGKNTEVLDAGQDVLDVTTKLAAKMAYRYVRVQFAPRQNGQQMTIVESDVWGIVD